jgi:hypothetical protein
MTLCYLLLPLLAGIPRPATASDAAPTYSQSYAIFLKGVPAGAEKITETTEKDGSLLAVSEHEILISDGLETKRMAFITTMRLAKGNLAPLYYSYKYTSGDVRDYYEVNVKNGQISRLLNRSGRITEVTAPLQPGLVILDFSVYHQYDYLIRKYDLRKQGRQSFHNFIPLIGSEIPLALTYLGESKLDWPGGVMVVRNFKIEFVGIWNATFSADGHGRLVRLLSPVQDLEVVRKDLIATER